MTASRWYGEPRRIRTPQSRAFFQRYTEQTKLVAGGNVEIMPLEIIAEAQHQA